MINDMTEKKKGGRKFLGNNRKKQTKTNYEYVNAVWNIMTGCTKDCEFCMIREFANHKKRYSQGDEKIHIVKEPMFEQKPKRKMTIFYPYNFEPTFYEYKLNALNELYYGKTIGVAFNGDLFDEAVPEEWILKIFDKCKGSDRYRFLFLTRNPARYLELGKKGLLPKGDKFWYGSTVSTIEEPIFTSKEHHTFVNIEPMQKPFDVDASKILERTEWVILGLRKVYINNKPLKVTHTDVMNVADACKKHNVPLYMRDSVLQISEFSRKDLIKHRPFSD